MVRRVSGVNSDYDSMRAQRRLDSISGGRCLLYTKRTPHRRCSSAERGLSSTSCCSQSSVTPPPPPLGPPVSFLPASVSLGFEADRSVVRNNEPVKLTVFARNDSSAPVETLRIGVEQVSKWRAGSDNGKQKRTIVSIVMSGSELGEVQNAAEEGDQRERRAAAVADVDRQNLQEMQAAGGVGTRHELLIPDECLQSLTSKLIEVSHTLSVNLATTSRCVADPELSIPLHVQAGAGVFVTPAGTNPIRLSLVEAGEGLGLVSVPQGAVKPEFSCELPQSLAPAH